MLSSVHGCFFFLLAFFVTRGGSTPNNSIRSMAEGTAHIEGRRNAAPERSGRIFLQDIIAPYRLMRRWTKQGTVWKRQVAFGSRIRSKRSIHNSRRRPWWRVPTRQGRYSLHNHARSPALTIAGLLPTVWNAWLTQPSGSRSPKLPNIINGRTYTMYHGTSCTAANSIQNKGFRPSSGGMLGSCVYMSRDLQKTFFYANQKLSPGQTGCIVKAKVDVGKVCTIRTQAQPNRLTWMNQCDSAWVPPGSTNLNPSGREESCIVDPAKIKFTGMCKYATAQSTNQC